MEKAKRIGKLADEYILKAMDGHMEDISETVEFMLRQFRPEDVSAKFGNYIDRQDRDEFLRDEIGQPYPTESDYVAKQHAFYSLRGYMETKLLMKTTANPN
jgi:hypothetical protein